MLISINKIKIIKILIFLILISFISKSAYSNNTSTTMTVSVKVLENYEKAKIIKTAYLKEENTITISSKTPLIFFDEKNNTKNMYIIREVNFNNYFCSQKFIDGSYIDDSKNFYLMDKQTNKFVINYLNEKTGKAIICPKINIKK